MEPPEGVDRPAGAQAELREGSTGRRDQVRELRQRRQQARLAGHFERPTSPPAQASLRRRLVDRAIAGSIDRLVGQLRDYAERLDDFFAALVDTIDRGEWGTPADDSKLRRRIASLERRLTTVEPDTDLSGPTDGSRRFDPWYSPQRFEDAFRGTAEDIRQRYRELTTLFEGKDPVLDIGCGRGELVRLLSDHGIDARGIDLDGDVIEDAVRDGLPVEQGDGIGYLRALPDASLGGVLAVQVIEHLSPQQLVDFVALAADKLRTGGLVFADTPNPQSLYVFTSALYLDPTHTTPIHPAYLAFLFREAGFAEVQFEHRSPVPDDIKLPSVKGNDEALVTGVNDVIRQLNELLYGAQDYAVVATR
jgi:SAM-dependent methyltransferase